MSSLQYSDAAILHVSLTDKTIERKPIPHDLFSQYLGGRGLGVKLLYDKLSPGVDPLSAEN
ncbi:MAG: aldehyde ferredoxin oxidoreductase N-terminal domain-containing protein, partial [Candidatus Thorarchaeota archaeon]